MELLSTVVQSLLDLGAAIFVPIIIILAGLIVKMKLKDAISAGLTLGVAFTGMTMLINFMTGAITPAAEAMLKNVGISLPIIDGDAISAGLTLGVAFTGMTMLINFMTGAITPAAEAMLKNVGISLPIIDGGWTTMSTISWSWPYAFLMFPLMITGAITPAAEAMLKNVGISLPIIDGGWTTMSTISWSWPYAFLMFPLMILINIVMLVLKKTNTFNADLWNVWGKIFTAVGVVAITGSVPLAFLVAAIQIIFELKTADVHQKRIEELSGIPGVTCTHKMVLFGALMYPVDVLLRKIPVFNKKFDAAALKDKVGIFAENHVLGFILGIVFGLMAGYDVSKTLTLAIQCATALTLFPVITKYFMQALSPISEAVSDYMNKRFEGRTLLVGLDWPFLGGSNEIWLAVIWAVMQALSPISEAVSDYMNKRFEGRTLLVGLDWPFLGGSNEIWLAVIWAVPVTLLCALFLPGNEILPFAGIINLALAVPAYLVTKGNLPRMLILCTLGVPAFLWVGTAFAPFITDLANATGAVALQAGEMISNSSIDAPVFTYAISQVFDIINGNWIPLVVLVVWGVCYVFYYRELKKENQQAEAETVQNNLGE